MRLPAELRNIIYEIVSTSWNDSEFSRGHDFPVEGHTERIECFKSLEHVAVQSSLFYTCSTIKDEGLSIFFQHHVFNLRVRDTGCFFGIILWLCRIGESCCKNIRQLRIKYLLESALPDKGFMERIHESLSEEATVTYTTSDKPAMLWKIGQQFWYEDSAKAPVFKIDGMDEEVLQYAEHESTNYRGDNEPDWSRLEAVDRSLEYAMVFPPNKGWFGP